MTARIAFISGQLRQGGAEQQLYHLLAGLDRSRFTPVVISLGPKSVEYWTNPIRDLDIPLWHFDRLLGRVGRTIQIARLLWKERIQIVHSWVFHTNPYASIAGRLSNVPVRLSSLRGSFKELSSTELVYWLGSWDFDTLITNSEIAANELFKCRRPRGVIRVVPNGVTIPKEIAQTESDHLKLELGFDRIHRLIGTIGTLNSNKNHQMLLKVFAKLINKWEGLRLVIIGEGPIRPLLLADIERLGLSSKVHLPGAMPHAAKYLPAMEVCLLSSFSEGMPNMIMEALAVARPVVSTNCGSIGALIDHGKTGYLVPVNDIESMSSYIDLLLGDPDRRWQMGKEGRKMMHDKFSVKLMVNRMMEIYEKALEEKYSCFN